MRRRRRWLWRAKWVGVAYCVSILFAFTLSTERRFVWISPSAQHWVSLQFGAVQYLHSPRGSPQFLWYYDPGWNVIPYGVDWSRRTNFGLMLRLSPATGSAGLRIVTIPLWMPILAFAIPTALTWRAHSLSFRRPGCCRNCGYNLIGNTSGVCPECGEKIRGSERCA